MNKVKSEPSFFDLVKIAYKYNSKSEFIKSGFRFVKYSLKGE